MTYPDDFARPDLPALDFVLPPHLEAGEPPEARGLARDEVRLMVSYRDGNRVVHTRFRDLPGFLDAGDVVVINTSGTLNAALDGTLPNGTLPDSTLPGGTPIVLHLSTRLPADLWLVEPRQPDGAATRRLSLPPAMAGTAIGLPGGASATLHAPYPRDDTVPTRLWVATLDLPGPLDAYLSRYGRPIRYGYVTQDWPPSSYQTVYVTEMGSAEMPSAGRAFSAEVMTGLVAHGIVVAPLLLHTGVASPEAHEPPYEEFYRVPLETARQVNAARAAGRRVVAVGTTVVRALETVTDATGTAHPGEGWTRLVVTPEQGLRAVSALLTGLHEPRSSHLAMLAALAGVDHLRITYDAALRAGYLWHEFGDLHLIL